MDLLSTHTVDTTSTRTSFQWMFPFEFWCLLLLCTLYFAWTDCYLTCVRFELVKAPRWPCAVDGAMSLQYINKQIYNVLIPGGREGAMGEGGGGDDDDYIDNLERKGREVVEDMDHQRRKLTPQKKTHHTHKKQPLTVFCQALAICTNSPPCKSARHHCKTCLP